MAGDGDGDSESLVEKPSLSSTPLSRQKEEGKEKAEEGKKEWEEVVWLFAERGVLQVYSSPFPRLG